MTAETHALLGAYVLDAVNDIERAAFERHLRECEACRDETDDLRAAAARLADGTWSVPPPSLRTNVLTAITSTRQVPPVSVPAPARPANPRWRQLTVAAAVVVAVGGSVAVVQEQRVRHEHADAVSARAAEARIQALLAAPDLTVREQRLTSGGKVTVAMSRLHDAGVIMLAADAAPAGGQVYQLWTVRSSTAASAGVLVPGQSAVVQIVEGMSGVSDVGVTVEPPKGSAQPTTEMIADLKLA
ncbi:anti-sigma factor [Actinoplanes sp. NPDC026619]|uniref:anti-sigma factor n=1 Tax=Actinoplanes sp. NPDC026619 TaxID=3155798 RepID=UPI0033DC83CC